MMAHAECEVVLLVAALTSMSIGHGHGHEDGIVFIAYCPYADSGRMASW